MFSVQEVCDPDSYFYNATQCASQYGIEPDAGIPWGLLLLIGLFILVGITLVVATAKIVKQFERGVVYRLGKVDRERKARQPGLNFIIPFIERMVKVVVAIEALSLSKQTAMTKDGVSLTIRTVVYFRVVDPIKAEVDVEDFDNAIQQLAQSAMLSVIGEHDLTEVLSDREKVTTAIADQIKETVSTWGIEVQGVALQDVELPDNLKRAMAAVAEAKRDADAKVAAAEGEKRSASILREAADELTPEALVLRRLQVLTQIGADQATFIVTDMSGDNVAAQAAAGAAAGSTARGAASPDDQPNPRADIKS